LGLLPSFICIILGKNLVLLPQTYGPFKRSISRYFARSLISKTATVLSRDREGVTLIKGLLKNKSHPSLHFCPDVAFVLEPVRPQKLQIDPEINGASTSIIGLNVNGLVYNGGYTRNNMFNLKLNYEYPVQHGCFNIICAACIWRFPG
jgi:colanic acid/amylovoran biosynthesis protein